MNTRSLLVVYGANCRWWDTIDKTGRIGEHLPCCPHCQSVLFQIEEDEWWKLVDKFDNEVEKGYRKFIEWSRGKCFPTVYAAQTAYEKE